MKMYEENPPKSWAVKLQQESSVCLVAVDAISGELIAYLINLTEHKKSPNVPECLEGEGYNPHEHGTQYDKYGRIILT